MISSRTQVGYEADFLRSFPNISFDDYMFKLSCARISLMSRDFTREKHLSEEQAEKYKRMTAKEVSPRELMMALSGRRTK